MTAPVTDKKSLVEAALAYASKGWPVFPVWWPLENGACACDKGLDCASPAKHPIYGGGFERATTATEIIEAYWTKYSNANIGMPTGRRSGALVVDVDTKSGGFESLAALINAHGE